MENSEKQILSEELDAQVLSSSLDDIIDTSAESGGVFTRYIPQKTIGEKIFAELHKRLIDLGKSSITGNDKKGFRMTDNSDDVGLIPQCQSLRALVSLARDFGLEFTAQNIIDGQSGTIREIMDAVIEDIVERIVIRDEQGKIVNFVFDASPYDEDHYTPEYSSVDAIAWVVPTFLLILDYHAGIREICKWEKELIATIKHGIRYLNEAYIRGDESDGEGLRHGWNFTKGCEEPSLYFSYIVCECFLDMFNTFEKILSYLEQVRNAERSKGKIRVNKDDENEFIDYRKKYAEGIGRDRGTKNGKQVSRYDDKYNELARIYRLINDIDDYDSLRIEDTLYGRFEANVKDVAAKVWGFVHEKLADKFFSNDLITPLDETDIRVSTTSDALFNTVYIINIMIDAGLDEDIRFEQQRLALSDDEKDRTKAAAKQREYNNLLESCQLAIQKAMRTYEMLKSDSKDYIVDQFLIGFNEKFDRHRNAVNELRKLRMKVFSLLPMLVHTNNVISEYLIKYPQYNMQKYLAYILDNRYTSRSTKNGVTDTTVHWIWEYDGFFSGSNYYYIAALKEFYAYYKVYEDPYLKNGEKNRVFKKQIETAQKDRMTAPGGEIAVLEAKLEAEQADKEAQRLEIEQLKAEKAQILAEVDQKIVENSPMEQAVKALFAEEIRSILADTFADILVETFEHAAKALTPSEVDDTVDTNGISKKLYRAMVAMMEAAVFSKQYTELNGKLKLSPEQYTKNVKNVEADFRAVIAGYITSVKNLNAGDRSKLVNFFDET